MASSRSVGGCPGVTIDASKGRAETAVSPARGAVATVAFSGVGVAGLLVSTGGHGAQHEQAQRDPEHDERQVGARPGGSHRPRGGRGPAGPAMAVAPLDGGRRTPRPQVVGVEKGIFGVRHGLGPTRRRAGQASVQGVLRSSPSGCPVIRPGSESGCGRDERPGSSAGRAAGPPGRLAASAGRHQGRLRRVKGHLRNTLTTCGGHTYSDPDQTKGLRSIQRSRGVGTRLARVSVRGGHGATSTLVAPAVARCPCPTVPLSDGAPCPGLRPSPSQMVERAASGTEVPLRRPPQGGRHEVLRPAHRVERRLAARQARPRGRPTACTPCHGRWRWPPEGSSSTKVPPPATTTSGARPAAS